MTETSLTRLLTEKGNPSKTRIELSALPELKPGQILLRPDRFSLTTNNITYALFGDAMQYWNFFPTGEAGWGHMPVWGFADIVASDSPGLEVGERFYGYFPIASHVVMEPHRVSERGFYDGAEHRRDLVSAYNQYTRCSADPAYAPEREALQALYRPLFITSFMLADYLADNGFFGAEQMVVSSASSKTAYGTVFCLGEGGIPATALTSQRNVGYVQTLDAYDAVATYEAVSQLDAGQPTLYVDFAGNGELRESIHRHFGDRLMHDCVVGATMRTQTPHAGPLAGPKPVFFFAPEQIAKRNADWGSGEVSRRYGESETRFFEHVENADPAWVSIEKATGFGAAQAVIADLAGNGGDPAVGHIVELERD